MSSENNGTRAVIRHSNKRKPTPDNTVGSDPLKKNRIVYEDPSHTSKSVNSIRGTVFGGPT